MKRSNQWSNNFQSGFALKRSKFNTSRVDHFTFQYENYCQYIGGTELFSRNFLPIFSFSMNFPIFPLCKTNFSIGAKNSVLSVLYTDEFFFFLIECNTNYLIRYFSKLTRLSEQYMIAQSERNLIHYENEFAYRLVVIRWFKMDTCIIQLLHSVGLTTNTNQQVK